MDTIMYASYGAFRANIAQDARQVQIPEPPFTAFDFSFFTR